jgi:endoglucanase
MVLSILGIAAAALAPLPALRMQGHRLVDPQGREVLLKGANLGNWQFDLESILTGRFGEAEKERLMNVYRSSWITERDFKILPTFGFNTVRLPMNYRLMEDDRQPYRLKKDAWRWVDHAINLAEKHGLYTILDMHGAQGGQSPYDHTGHSDQNRLKNSPEDQKRLAWLWGEIAKRYRNRSAVVAYDVWNEPYGVPKPKQKEIFSLALAAIRKVDPEKLVYAMGNYDDFDHYGDPKANGWHNVGFQMHYYPGMFGGGDPTIKTQQKHLARLEDVAAQVRKLDVPFLIGEMNVVFDAAGGADMMRRTYDQHASYGWGTTMWSYKIQNAAGGHGNVSWGAVANAKPAAQIDFRTDSKAAIEAYFRSFAAQELEINRPLQKVLGDPSYRPTPLPPTPPKRTAAPSVALPGWSQTNIGGALAGGLEGAADRFSLFGGGRDVWGARDEFRFLHREIEGDFTLSVTIEGIEEIDAYTKAGLMIRASASADAPFAMLSSFPSGEVQLAHRDAAGGEATAPPMAKGVLPGLRLRLVRKGGTITGSYFSDGAWKTVASVPDRLPAKVLVGAIASSHDASQLVKVDYREFGVVKG